MKYESGMTKDIEQVAKELYRIYWDAAEYNLDTKDGFDSLAKWHLRQVRIAEIKGRIEEHKQCCDCLDYFARICIPFNNLKAQLAEAEKE